MGIKHRRCWSFTGRNFVFDTPRRTLEEGREIEVSRLHSGRGICVVSGQLAYIKETGSQRLLLGTLLPGDIVGAVDEAVHARSHTLVKADSPTEICLVTWNMVREKVKEEEPLEFPVKALLKKGTVKINPSAYLVQDPVKRMARFFWLLSDLNPEKEIKGHVYVDTMLQALAGFLAMTEVETALAAGYLESEGILELSAEGFRVLSPERLSRMCEW